MKTKNILDKTSGVEWGIHIVPPNGRYGLCGQVTNSHGEALVEFYDLRHEGYDELGFFVTRYLTSTLLKHEGGLCLNGSPLQNVDAAFMDSLRDWLETIN